MNREKTAARLLRIFLGELEEQLENLNRDLLALEQDPSAADRLRSVFRIMHSLKGAASAAHVPLIERVCHGLESLLAKARDGNIPLTKEHFSLLFATADALADAGKKVGEGLDLTDSPLAAIEARLKRESGLDAALGRSPVPAKSAAPREPPAGMSQGVLAPPAAPEPTSARTAGQVRVDTRKVDDLFATAGQLRSVAGRIQSRSSDTERIYERADRWRTEWEGSVREVRRAVMGNGSAAPILRVLDDLQDRLRRLVRDTSQLATLTRQDARLLARESAEVVDGVRSLRLRPFSDACLALPRAVRDIAGTHGKEVKLEIVGRDVEADRAVLDLLHDVLLQLVRNAVDHGIELPAERLRAGKPRVGKVRVAAASTGQRLVITVSDDGSGLDVEAIRNQLKLRGLPVPSTREELGLSVLRAGFSTRGVATPTSGRGVGLDIAVSSLDRMGGSVRVEWTEGGGTTFILECSPSLATAHAVLARVGTQTIAIPSAHVQHLLTILPEEIRRAEGRAVMLTPAGAVPLASLARLLGPPLEEEQRSGALAVLLLAAGGQRLGVAVDELLADEEIIVRALTGKAMVPFVAGASVLQSGRLALVLNTAAILAEGVRRGGIEPTVDSTSAEERRSRILVVDDSITTRTLEQSILEAAGFDVTTAVDGHDAWTLLQDQPFDLVVSDVEMPRMDGFSLCKAIRDSERFGALPVILVTALDAPEHRSRGMKAGADAYLPKTSFDHHDLLDTIRQLLG